MHSRKSVLLTAAAVCAMAVAATPAHALFGAGDVVLCANCSTRESQIVALAKQAQQVATQLRQYQTQLQQYANMVRNTTALPEEAWADVQSDIMQVQSLSSAGSLLSGNSASIISRLQSGTAYADRAARLGNIAGQLTSWQRTIGDNLGTMGKTLGLQQTKERDNAALLAALQHHSASAQGQMQAIEAGNELAGANAAELQQIHQTLIATAQMQAQQMAVDADRRAQENAEEQHFINGGPKPVDSGRSWW